MKRILSGFWMQTGLLIALVVVAASVRLMLPTSEPGQISPLYFIIEIANYLIALAAVVIMISFLYSIGWMKNKPFILQSIYFITIYLIFNLLFNSFHGWDRIIPSFFHEYYEDSLGLARAGNLLGDWTTNVMGRSIHATVHPPGLFLYLMALNQLFGDGIIADWLTTVFLVSLSSMVIYLILKRISSVEIAFMGTLLYITSGNLIFYGGTVDGIICAYTVLIVFMIVRMLKNANHIYAFLIGIALALGVFLAYQYILILCFYILILLFHALIVKGIKALISNTLLFLTSLMGLFTVFILLSVFANFNVIHCFFVQQKNSEQVCFAAGWNVFYWIKTQFLGAETYTGPHRDYWLWMPGNFLAYLFIIGPTTAILFWRRFLHVWHNRIENTISRALVLATGSSFVLIGLSGLVLGETERVWLFMLPFFIVSAAPHFAEKQNLPDYKLIIGVNLMSLWILDLLARAIN